MPQRPTVPGYTHIEDAPAKWGADGTRKRDFWYSAVRVGDLTGYDIPGLRGTWLRDDEVIAYLTPKPKTSGAAGDSSRAS